MITKFFKYSCCLVLILSCAGCLKTPIQKPHKIMPLSKATAHDTQTKQDVTVHSKKLTSTELKDIFGDYTQKQLEKYHIAPIQITIENNSATAWVLADKNITLNKLSIDEVNAKLYSSLRLRPLWIFLGGTAAALLIAPYAFAFLLWSYSGPSQLLVINQLIAIISMTIYFLPAIIFATTSCIAIADGISTHQSRKQMAEYLKNNCNREGITINPDISASMLFFVEESQLPEKLNLLLTDKATEENTLPFELNL